MRIYIVLILTFVLQDSLSGASEVNPIFCEGEANEFPTSMKFLKQPNEVIDHILSLMKDSSWFKEAKLQLPNRHGEDTFIHEGKKERIIWHDFNAKITGMNTISRYGDSCFFYSEGKEKVGVKGTLRMSPLKARYKQSISVLSEYINLLEYVHTEIDHLDYSFKIWPNWERPCSSSKDDYSGTLNCKIDLKLEGMEIGDISFEHLKGNIGKEVREVLKQHDIDLKNEARKTARRRLGYYFGPSSVGAIGWIQYWLWRALETNEEKFFENV